MEWVKFAAATLFAISVFGFAAIQADETEDDSFKYFIEQFADLKIGRYQIPGFNELEPAQKEMLYYLYQAALSGRDIFWDQNCRYNLAVRRTLEAIVSGYGGDRNTEDFRKFMVYTKRVWFSNGIHHHYSTDKIMPGFSSDYFIQLIKNSRQADFPVRDGETLDAFITRLTPVIFDPEVAPKRVNTDPNADMIAASANNYYEDVTQEEAEAFYENLIRKDDPRPVSYGLNSKLLKINDHIQERVWKVGGMYSPAIEEIVYWLEKARDIAENDQQKEALSLLVDYYKSGELKTFDDYSIAWIADTASRIDVTNGFIETYGDPLSYRASYESVVSIRDMEASRRAESISQNANWFEKNSPIAEEHKKKEVRGITAKVITVVALGGDASPNPPIGINLPNANWIRKEYGSKSVTLGNISYAYNKVAEGAGLLEEYAWSQEEIKRAKEYGELSDNLHTDLHEVIGHASGQINAGVGTPKETLKNYAPVIEEARADLVAYYYLLDPKLIEIGVMPTLEVGKVAYDKAFRNGLIQQLTRIKLGDDIEQAHMRNRQLIAKWAMELGKTENVVEKKVRDGKTYFTVNDYRKLRQIFGNMLREIQRIKSEGDFQAARNLVETYAVKIDPGLHREILARYEKLGAAPYTGFINPVLIPVMKDGQMVDVRVEYPADFTSQMLDYGKNYSFLPTEN